MLFSTSLLILDTSLSDAFQKLDTELDAELDGDFSIVTEYALEESITGGSG